MEIDAKILEKFNILKKDENVPSTLHEKIEAEKFYKRQSWTLTVNTFL